LIEEAFYAAIERRYLMKEIIGDNLEKVMEVYNINATKTYQSSNETTDFSQVWELSEDDLEKLCNISDDNWLYEYGWFRSAEGSNMGVVHKRYNINNHYINAWDGAGREDQEEENKSLSVDDRLIEPRKYHDLLEYFCEELGASTEKNVTALAIDLAKENDMKVSELFKKYQD
jgi:hypothetical protein